MVTGETGGKTESTNRRQEEEEEARVNGVWVKTMLQQGSRWR